MFVFTLIFLNKMEVRKMEEISKEGVKLKCQRCGYVWVYKGTNPYYGTCTRCAVRVSILKNKIEE